MGPWICWWNSPAGPPSNGAGAKAVPAGPGLGQPSAEGLPCSPAEPAPNVAVTEESSELDAEALETAPGGPQRAAEAAGELMAALDAEAD
jgi:hypothetical protein